MKQTDGEVSSHCDDDSLLNLTKHLSRNNPVPCTWSRTKHFVLDEVLGISGAVLRLTGATKHRVTNGQVPRQNKINLLGEGP
jgi:hypothetical protein